MTNSQNQTLNTIIASLMVAAVLWVGDSLTKQQAILAGLQRDVLHVRSDITTALDLGADREKRLEALEQARAAFEARLSAMENHHD